MKAFSRVARRLGKWALLGLLVLMGALGSSGCASRAYSESDAMRDAQRRAKQDQRDIERSRKVTEKYQKRMAQLAARPPKPEAPKKKTNFLFGWWEKIWPKKETPPAAMPPQLIGEVVMYHREENYVMIDGLAIAAALPGQELICLNSGRKTAVVRAARERKPPFLIAEIIRGKPVIGDKVYAETPTTP